MKLTNTTINSNLTWLMNITTSNHTRCFTASTTVQRSKGCTFDSKACIRPQCIGLTTTTIPGPQFTCPSTSTITFTRPCATRCPAGCGLWTSTILESFSCDYEISITHLPFKYCPLMRHPRCGTSSTKTEYVTVTPSAKPKHCTPVSVFTSRTSCPALCPAEVTSTITVKNIKSWLE